MDHLAGVVSHYGYAAVLLGALVEGETVVVLAAALAASLHFSLAAIWLAALVGSFSGDQLGFWVGRRFAHAPNTGAGQLGVVLRWLRRHAVLTILSLRFLYGLRAAGPALVGMSEIGAGFFAALNFLSAMVWAALFTLLGHALGTAFMRWHGVPQLVFCVGIVLMLAAAAHLLRKRFGVSGP